MNETHKQLTVKFNRAFTTSDINYILDEFLPMRKHILYRNVDGFKNSNLIVALSPEEKVEYVKCASDPVYFIETHCDIKLRDYQKDIIEKFQKNRFNIVMNSRQTGMTTIIMLLMLWILMFNANKNIMLVVNKLLSGADSMNKLQTLYRKLPFYLKPGVLNYSKSHIIFDNECRLSVCPTSKEYAVGYSTDYFFIQDYAFINPNVLSSLFPTLTQNYNSRVFIQSSPNGFNSFYELFTNAERNLNSFIPTRIYWWQVPGRDEAWKEKEIRNLGSLESFLQEYELLFIGKKRD